MKDSVNIHMEDYVSQVEDLAKAGKKLVIHRRLRDVLNTPGSIARRHLSSMKWLEEDGADMAMLNRYLSGGKADDEYFKTRLLDIGKSVVFYDNQVSLSCDIQEIFLNFESVNDKNRIIKELKLKVEVDD